MTSRTKLLAKIRSAIASIAEITNHLRRGEARSHTFAMSQYKLKVIEDVPAGVCQQCGEKYFEAAVYKVMEELAASQIKPVTRLTVDVVHFQRAV